MWENDDLQGVKALKRVRSRPKLHDRKKERYGFRLYSNTANHLHCWMLNIFKLMPYSSTKLGGKRVFEYTCKDCRVEELLSVVIPKKCCTSCHMLMDVEEWEGVE